MARLVLDHSRLDASEAAKDKRGGGGRQVRGRGCVGLLGWGCDLFVVSFLCLFLVPGLPVHMCR